MSFEQRKQQEQHQNRFDALGEEGQSPGGWTKSKSRRQRYRDNKKKKKLLESILSVDDQPQHDMADQTNRTQHNANHDPSKTFDVPKEEAAKAPSKDASNKPPTTEPRQAMPKLSSQQFCLKIELDQACLNYKLHMEVFTDRMSQCLAFNMILAARNNIKQLDDALKVAAADFLAAISQSPEAKNLYVKTEKDVNDLRDKMKHLVRFYRLCKPLWTDSDDESTVNSMSSFGGASADRDYTILQVAVALTKTQLRDLDHYDKEAFAVENLSSKQWQVYVDMVTPYLQLFQFFLDSRESLLKGDSAREAMKAHIAECLRIARDIRKKFYQRQQAAAIEEDARNNVDRQKKEDSLRKDQERQDRMSKDNDFAKLMATTCARFAKKHPPPGSTSPTDFSESVLDSDEGDDHLESVSQVGATKEKQPRHESTKISLTTPRPTTKTKSITSNTRLSTITPITSKTKAKTEARKPVRFALSKDSSITEILKMKDDFTVDWNVIYEAKQESMFIDRDLTPATKLEVASFDKFSGENILAWPTFKTNIDSCIILKKNLDWHHKQHYLMESLEGYALRLVEDYPRGRQGFARVLFVLDEEFGCFDKYKDVLVRQVKELPPLDKRNLSTIREARVILRKIVLYAARSDCLNAEVWAESLLPIVPMDKWTQEHWDNFLDKKEATHGTLDLFESWTKTLINRLYSSSTRTTPAPKEKSTRRTWEARKPVVLAAVDESSDEMVIEEDVISLPDNELQSCPVLVADPTRHCLFCDMNGHDLAYCGRFRGRRLAEKREFVSENKICFKCLSDTHLARACTSNAKCQRCQSADHHTLLHQIKPVSEESIQSLHQKLDQIISMQSKSINNDQVYPVLSAFFKKFPTCFRVVTLDVSLSASFDYFVTINAVLDEASRATFITEGLADELECDRSCIVDQRIQMLGIVVKMANAQIQPFYLREMNSSQIHKTSVFTVPSLPPGIKRPDYEGLRKVFPSLSACRFPEVNTNEVKMLIGLDNYHLMASEMELPLKQGEPYARRCPLGWTLTFASRLDDVEQPPVCVVNIEKEERLGYTIPQSVLDNALKNYFDLESVNLTYSPTPKLLTKKEKAALDMILHSTVQLRNGQYMVRVPWNDKLSHMPNNFKAVQLQQRRAVAKMMKDNPDIIKCVRDQFKDFAERGWIEKLDPKDPKSLAGFWLAWFVVTVLTKSTPHRIVFDCARKFYGKCLNDAVLPGPKTQNDIIDILIKFRMNPIAIASDVSKMYMNFVMYPEDRQYHRFLDDEGNIWQFKSFIFGNSASPFVCIYTMAQHIAAFASESTKDLVQKCFYVDDLLVAFKTVEQAKATVNEVVDLLDKVGLPLRKFVSNSEDFLQSIPKEWREKSFLLQNPEQSISTLGMKWLPQDDVFTFQDKLIEQQQDWTKRRLSSVVASIYDPLGLITPFTLLGALLLQDVCRLSRDVEISWDTIFTPELHPEIVTILDKWNKFVKDLSSLSEFRFPRCITYQDSIKEEIHIFSDGSKRAFAFVVYLVSYFEDKNPISHLLYSGKRLAPLKARTIPQNELMAAVLASRHALRLFSAHERTDFIFWIDSKCVLHWLADPTPKHQTFVMTRVMEIKDNTCQFQCTWRYIPTKQNPADLPTRGLHVADLASSDFWLRGPSFLQQGEEFWPEKILLLHAADLHGLTEFECLMVFNDEQFLYKFDLSHSDFLQWQLQNLELHEDQKSQAKIMLKWHSMFSQVFDLSRYLTMSKAVQVVIQVVLITLRWRKISCPTNVDMISVAKAMLIKSSQAESFPEELRTMVVSGSFANTKLGQLRASFDKSGFLRLFGRWSRDKTREPNWRSPMLLHYKSRLAVLIANELHEQLGHGVPVSKLRYEIMQKWHIVGLNLLVKSVLRSCAKCRQKHSPPLDQLMSLPYHTPFNVATFRPFSEVSMDFCGPFEVKVRRSTEQRYALVAVCQQTKGVFVEDTMSLSTDELMMALEIMASERGCPSALRSDNATAFCKARDLVYVNKQLESTEQAKQAVKAAKLEPFLKKLGVQAWTLSAPKAAHTNGLAERFVGIFKAALLMVSKEVSFTPMSFRMFLKRAQSAVNSRPIIQVDVGEEHSKIILTPNHFQRANVHADLDPKILHGPTEKLLTHYLQVDDVIDDFWDIYKSTILYESHKFTKWDKQKADVKLHELVMVFDPADKTRDWHMGEIVKLYPEKDGLVRRVDVRLYKTSQLDKNGRLKNVSFKIFQRNIQHLVPLRLFVNDSNPTFSQEIYEKLREKK